MDLTEDKKSGMSTVDPLRMGPVPEVAGHNVEMAKLEKLDIFNMIVTLGLTNCRSKFYKEAKESFAVVHTGETALYGNIILTKGVVAS